MGRLKKFPDTPVSTPEEAREFRPHPEDPLIHAKGRATLLLQLGRKAHGHAPTRDGD